MSTVPALAGLATVICVPESAVTFAVARPKLTRVAPERPVPVMVTLVPPAGDPLAGDTPVTAGSNECEPPRLTPVVPPRPVPVMVAPVPPAVVRLGGGETPVTAGGDEG